MAEIADIHMVGWPVMTILWHGFFGTPAFGATPGREDLICPLEWNSVGLWAWSVMRMAWFSLCLG